MDYTANYHLHKPAAADFYDVADQNANMDAIDTELAGRAQKNHSHSAADVTGGVLPVERGGTGQVSLQAVRSAMGLGNTAGALPVANGGTGAADAAGARANLEVRPLAGTPVALGTDILTLAPGVYSIDGVDSPETAAAMNLPVTAWHFEVVVYATNNKVGQQYNYKTVLAFPFPAKRYYMNMMSWDGNWTGWSFIYTSGDKPTASDVGALPITGGTLTGELVASETLAVNSTGDYPGIQIKHSGVVQGSVYTNPQSALVLRVFSADGTQYKEFSINYGGDIWWGGKNVVCGNLHTASVQAAAPASPQTGDLWIW